MSYPIDRQWFTNHSWYAHVGTSTYPVCPATTVHGICTRSLGWLHLGCSGRMQVLGQWDTQANIQVIQQTMILFPLKLVRLRWQEAGIFSEQINSFDSQLLGNLQFNAFNLITVHSSLQEWHRSQTLNTKCLLQLTIFRWQKREGHFSTLKNNTSAKTLHFFHAIKKSFWFCFCL